MVRFWRSDKKGSTAIEFAFVGLPFIWMLVGMVELTLYFASSSLLAEATNTGARMIRTGQLAGSGDPEQAFQDAVCARAAVFIPCNGIQFQVTHVADDNFQSVSSYAPTYDDDGNLEGQGYQSAGDSDVMIVRLAYRYPFMTPIFSNLLADESGASRLILNTVVMKSEPFDA